MAPEIADAEGVALEIADAEGVALEIPDAEGSYFASLGASRTAVP